MERGTLRISCLAQEHNTVIPASARIGTACFGMALNCLYLEAEKRYHCQSDIVYRHRKFISRLDVCHRSRDQCTND